MCKLVQQFILINYNYFKQKKGAEAPFLGKPSNPLKALSIRESQLPSKAYIRVGLS